MNRIDGVFLQMLTKLSVGTIGKLMIEKLVLAERVQILEDTK
jgi:hypothetical protein